MLNCLFVVLWFRIRSWNALFAQTRPRPACTPVSVCPPPHTLTQFSHHTTCPLSPGLRGIGIVAMADPSPSGPPPRLSRVSSNRQGGAGYSAYFQIALYAAGHVLALLVGCALWIVYTLLYSFQEPLLWAWLCSVALRDVRNYLLEFLRKELAERPLPLLVLRWVFLPFLVLFSSFSELREAMKTKYEQLEGSQLGSQVRTASAGGLSSDQLIITPAHHSTPVSGSRQWWWHMPPTPPLQRRGREAVATAGLPSPPHPLPACRCAAGLCHLAPAVQLLHHLPALREGPAERRGSRPVQ